MMLTNKMSFSVAWAAWPAGVALLILAIFPGWAGAFGVKASPGAFILHNVQPGRVYDVYQETGSRVTVYNDSPERRTYSLSVARPSGKVLTGYRAIPDPRWCRFDPGEVEVEGMSRGYGYLKIQIPDEEKYYNQSWVVPLTVQIGSGRGIAVAVQIRAQIETKSRDKLSENPDGVMAFSPSVLRFEDIALGSARKGSVTIYNNDAKTRKYKITSLFRRKGIKPRTYLTHSYEVIPDPKWVGPGRKRLKIKAGKTFDLSLQVKVPDRPEYRNRKWEELLLVEPDEGLPGFIRVQFSTEE